MAIRFSKPSDRADILATNAKVLVNTVNCVGVMGKGVAKAFADRFPAIMPSYREACSSGALKPGVLLETRIDPRSGAIDPSGSLTILHFPTKVDWRNPSRMEWIDQGLSALAEWLEANPTQSIAIPPLGCGNGGLSWSEVAPRIVSRLSPFADRLDVQLLGPDPSPAKATAAAPAAAANPITEFQGENRLYSNMYPAAVMWGDEFSPPRLLPCTEVGYVMAKTTNPALRSKVLEVYEEAERAKPGSGGGAVKRFGRSLPIRPDWDSVKISVMEALVLDKFTRNAELRDRLLATGDRELREGNWWGDTFWGVSLKDLPQRNIRVGQGRNELGKILMRTRDHLRSAQRDGPQAATLAASPSELTKPAAGVVNLKAVRASARDSLPADVLDCSRYGKVAFVDGTKLGNPFVMSEYGGRDGNRDDVIRKHAQKLANDLKKPGFAEWLAKTTSGKRLGCFCKPAACHCDTIMAAANAIITGRDPQQAIKPFLSLGQAPAPGEAPAAGATTLAYAGIGARATPPAVLAKMRQIGELLAATGWTLRSGGADGADINFERGCDDAGGKKKIFLPWPSFEAKKEIASSGYRPVRPAGSVFSSVSSAALELARKFHPAWERLSGPDRKLQGRNSYQVLDLDLASPVGAVICWTVNGLLKGGTAQALRLAEAHGVPAINLGSERWRDATPQEIADAAMEMALKRAAAPKQATREAAPATQPQMKAATASAVTPIKNSLLMR